MNHGQGRGRGRNRGAYRGQGQRLRGLFAEGIWHCDCNPRLPAEHFKVKKEGRNHGRWFYTCQQAESARCGFFLWDDDAKIRERGAILENSMTEPRSTANAATSKHDIFHEQPPSSTHTIPVLPAYLSQFGSGPSSQVHHRQDNNNDEYDDDTEGWSVVDARRLEADAMAEYQQSLPPQAPRTPIKRSHSAMNENAPHGLPTPQTGSRLQPAYGDAGGTSSKRRAAEADFLNFVSPATTPSPLQHRDASDATADDPLFVEIKQILSTHGVHLDPETTKEINVVCSRSTLRHKGVTSGREIARLALKAKLANVVELQHRITTLEAELEMERAIVKHLREENQVDQ